MAMDYLPTAMAEQDTSVDLEILGEMFPATVQTTPAYHPNGGRMRD